MRSLGGSRQAGFRSCSVQAQELWHRLSCCVAVNFEGTPFSSLLRAGRGPEARTPLRRQPCG